MVASIIMIALAFAWLMYETDFMRVRLESTEYQCQQLAIKAKRDFGNMPMGKVNAESSEDTTPLKPLEFTPLDMPEFTGTLNIICERG